MKIKVGRKNINVEEVNGFFKRFKCMKFVLEPISEGFCFPKKKSISTYFFCQRVDIVMTDKDDKILFMYPYLASEKRKLFKRKVYYTYILPLGTCEKLKIGEKLKKMN